MITSTKTTLRDLFAKAQKNEQSKVAASYQDERFLVLKPGRRYRVRLLFSPTEKRSGPFIETKIHRNYNPNLRKYTKVLCPSSDYLEGYEGYKMCPVCQAAGKFYEKAQLGDANAQKMYNSIKRITENYAVVYVVQDSLEGEGNVAGKIKILKYGFDIQKVFDRFVMGKPVKGEPEIDPEEVIGYDAFDLENGRDLIISVGSKKVGAQVYPEYNASFSGKYSSVPLTEEEVVDAVKKLRFDEDFFVDYDMNAINAFYKEIVLKESGADLDINEDKSDDEGEDEDDSEVFKKPVKKVTPAKKFDLEDDEEEEPTKSAKSVKKAPVIEDEDDEDDLKYEDDEEEKPVKKVASAKKSSASKFDLDDDEDEDEEEPVKPVKKAKKVVKKEPEPSEDEDDEDWEFNEDDE